MSTRFLGAPPAPTPDQYIGRITVLSHDPRATWSAGALVLPDGTAVHWITYAHGVEQHRDLLRPDVRTVVTAYTVGGDVYLTGIREATAAEWQDAVDTLAGTDPLAWPCTACGTRNPADTSTCTNPDCRAHWGHTAPATQ